jgi:transcriptional regulator with XRE-family HTH domain
MNDHHASLPPGDKESPDIVLARNLLVARAVRNITQNELSNQSGISRATIAQLESGDSDPRLSTIFLLAEALEVPLILLLIGVAEANALAELPRKMREAQPLAIPAPDLRRMQLLVDTGLLKDRMRAACLGAAVAQQFMAGSAVSEFPSTAILSGFLPGKGSVVGYALDQALNEQQGVHAMRASHLR